jgi:acetylornithine deacetylase
MMNNLDTLTKDAIHLLKEMIAIPSFSKEEEAVASCIESFLHNNGIKTHRLLNNIYAFSEAFDVSLPTIILNSHHDTVQPAKGYDTDPFTPTIIDDKLIGLGSNDAGGALVSLIATFIYFQKDQSLPFNFCLIASAEEEISGKNGVELLLNNDAFKQQLRKSTILGAIVGEPTKMEMAVAERGLLVIDAVAHGIAGHAAREEGINAIDIAINDIKFINEMVFEKVSPLTGKATAKVTVIETENKAHNVVPASCRFVIDVRVNENYSFEEILQQIQSSVKSELTPRSFRLRSTMIDMQHPIVKAGKQLGWAHYGSPTTSDKALMPFPALKIGPGDSARSHTANEYILLNEISLGIKGYIDLLKGTAEQIKQPKEQI